MRLHWFADSSTFNGQPFSPDVETMCGKKHEEETADGDRITRVGACHPYQVTCPQCKYALDQRSRDGRTLS